MELPNEKANDASRRVWCFDIPNDLFRQDRSYKGYADSCCSQNRSNRCP
jgi:hypothetical protein